MAKVTWEQYRSLHHIVSEEEFDIAEAIAENEVQRVIGIIRWGQITEETYGYSQLQECICNVIDKMATDAKSGKGKGISSASNDGYSESYVVQTEEQLRSELQSSIKAWLSGTGLVGAY
nr:MAG TPA: Head Tail Connector Protein [Caudoviricetes sp.]